MIDLFANHHERHERLEVLAKKLFQISSLVGLHAWYQSSKDLRQASEDAEDAGRILLGKSEVWSSQTHGQY